MWHQLLGLAVVFSFIVLGAICMILRDGRRYDDHVTDALELANEEPKR